VLTFIKFEFSAMIKLKHVAICFGTLMYFAGCNGNTNKLGGDTSKMNSFGLNSNSNILLGAGTNSVYALFSKLFAEYGKNNKIRVNYQSIGSQRGIMGLVNKNIDFAVIDTLLNNKQTKKIGADVLLVPVCPSAEVASKPNTKDTHPIAGVTRILIYKEQNYDGRSRQRAEKLITMLWWDIHDGQKYCESLNYAALSPQAVTAAEKTLKSATFDGKPLLP
jgi:ABC-type phosphate transport system substrate-binding protein